MLMLTIARIRLRNFKIFYGETVLDLAPQAYGIFARDASDPDRSNFLGKSTLLHAVDLALTGRLPYDCQRKVDWISRGEDEGSVEVLFSNGAGVRRELSLKGSERITFSHPGRDNAIQEEAEKRVDELLGLSREDAPTWCFRQGEMSELLKMDPAPRLQLFSDWIRLGRLEECQGLAAAARGEIRKKLDERKRALDQLEFARVENLRAVSLAPDGPDQVVDLDAIIAEAEAELALLLPKKRAADEAAAVASERASLERDAADYDRTVTEGMSVAQRLREMATADEQANHLAEGQKEEIEAHAEVSKAADAWQAASAVTAGYFSGTCPVVSSPCPSAAFVKAEALTKKTLVDDAKARLDEWKAVLEGARDRTVLARIKVAERTRAEQQLESLRATARRLKERRDRYESLRALPPVPIAEQSDAITIARAESRLTLLRRAREANATFTARCQEVRAEVAALEATAEIPEAAALVFERARKQIAEEVLAEVEQNGNDVLATLGIDATVAVRWGREGDGLADACGSCGAAFPASRRVKVCARCGAERGPKVVERLEIVPSRRSGAADDFAGFAVALGASRWLREERGSAWGTTLLDEPVAQVDRAYRRSFASKLPEVLRMSGFGQALVTAHHPDVLETLPGKILVESQGGRSTARVV
jgi:DNA repair exonuclease SbcCD ATPase subunit